MSKMAAGGSAPPSELQPSQSSSSRMMKTTQRGRPFTKDTHDLFATLVVSLRLGTHRHMFKTFNNSFNTDEAAENLSALKFSQSNRVPDPKDPSRVVTTTTTTTFSMSRDMAKGICQHFMDARLIENAVDLANPIFKDKGIYMLTPKGLHILERFITKNGINGEHLLKVFSSQPICMKLLHLERRLQDDELVITRGVLEVIFRRFAGRQPNYPTSEAEGENHCDRTLGVEVNDITEKGKSSKQGTRNFQHTFTALTAIEWLLDFTTMCGRDEAAEVAAHFQRLKLIELAVDRKSKDENDHMVTVYGDEGFGGSTMGELRCHAKAIYCMTDWGRTVARWPGYNATEAGQTTSFSSNAASSITNGGSSHQSDHGMTTHLSQQSSQSSDHMYQSLRDNTRSSTSLRSDNMSDGFVAPRGGLFAGDISSSAMTRDSNSKRLRQILEEPALRSLFRDFLRQNYCEENLSFWLDVQDFKRRFHTTSSAQAVTKEVKKDGMVGAMRKLGVGKSASQREEASGATAMEKHQRDLIAMAFVIYNTYLAPSSSCELNVEHSMRTDLVNFMDKVLTEAKGAEGLNEIKAKDINRGPSDASKALEERRNGVNASMPRAPLHASQLQQMVRLYERVQEHIFRLMATDSVPRFIKEPRFLNLVRSVEEYTEALEAGRIDPSQHAGPALGRSVVEALDLNSIASGEQGPETELTEVLNDGPTTPGGHSPHSANAKRRASSATPANQPRRSEDGIPPVPSVPSAPIRSHSGARSDRSKTVTARDRRAR